jgi:methyl-accepting chemotaxis protein
METIKSNTRILFSTSIFCLALAIAYFAYELYKFRTGFPEILTKMEQTSAVIYPTMSGIAKISDNIPPIAEAIDQMHESLPSLLAEVKATRESLPDLLKQVDDVAVKIEQTAKVIPGVLEEVKKTREMVPGVVEEIHAVSAQVPLILTQVNGIREQIPAIIQTVDKAADATRTFSTQLAETNKMIPDILEETKKTREAMPELMDRAEKIVTQGGQFGSEAGKGAISGLFMSVVNPMNVGGMLKNLVLPGKEIPALTEADIALIRETARDVLINKKPGETIKWDNPVSNNFGKVTLIREFFDGDDECNEIRAEIWIKKGFMRKDKTHDFNMVICRKPDGSWSEKGDPMLNKNGN